MKIPFVDLSKQHSEIKIELDEAIKDVISNSNFIRGPHVDAFEKNFSKITGSRYTVSCGNGTDALYIALNALGLKAGDEVIAPAHSWISTTETITQAGGRVVFCDTTDDTFTICPKHLRRLINHKTKGIIPVHLFGQAAEMNAIQKIADENNLWIIEDCAQAHLAKHNGINVGNFGIASTYSFYPGKNLGAMGDAGAICTANKEMMLYMTKFARHGGLAKGDHEIEGINSRLDGLQAAVLNIKMKYIAEWTKQRQSIASKYIENINNPHIVTPRIGNGNDHVWHLFVIKCDYREKLSQYLTDRGIQTNINYKTALPFLPAYKRFNHKPSEFPNAFSNQSKILSIPIYPGLSEVECNYIIDSLNKFSA